MLSTFERILSETSQGVSRAPTERQIEMARMALGGKSTGEIRSAFPGSKVEQIAAALRSVRDAARSGKAPETLKSEFPEIISAVASGSPKVCKPGPSLALARSLSAASKDLEKPVDSKLQNWILSVKARFASIMVPLTLRMIAEGVERGEAEMIKLSSQAFQIVPSAGKGLTLAQFNLGAGDRGPARERRAPYFEKLLREVRTTAEVEVPIQATDMPEDSEESESST